MFRIDKTPFFLFHHVSVINTDVIENILLNVVNHAAFLKSTYVLHLFYV